jgi:anti-sigma B factor antagonist
MAAEEYAIWWVGEQAVIATPAEIDVMTAGEVRQALLSAASLGAPVLIIDMSRTTFCDSAGVGAIVAAQQQAAQNGTQFRLVATTVLRILTLVGIDQITPIYPTLEEALAATPAAKTGPQDTRVEQKKNATGNGHRQAERPPGST